MSASGQTVTPLHAGSTDWLRVAHFLVALIGLVVAVMALLTRPEALSILRAAFKGIPSLRVVPPSPSVDPTLNLILHAVQAGVIIGFIFIHHIWLRDIASGLTEQVPIAKKTLEQFTNGWLYMWYGWLAVYIWFFVAAMPQWNGSPRMDAVSDVIDVAGGFAIWWCFLVLDMPSVNLADQPHRDRAFRRTVLITGIAGVICACLGAADRLFDWSHARTVVGLYNALALAFFTGRMGSHYINVRRWLLLCLYLYSMLQVFYSFLDLLKPGWTPLVFLLALFFKITLAYAGYDMMQHGGLLRYLNAAESGLLNPPGVKGGNVDDTGRSSISRFSKPRRRAKDISGTS
jgi:hypothetical protein